MIKNYLQQAVTMLRQQPLFSTFYIVATGLAISMVMVVAVLYYVKVGDIYPETHRSRMLVATSVHMQDVGNTKYNSSGGLSRQLVEDCFYPLEGVEAVSAMSKARSQAVKVAGRKRPLNVLVKQTDTAFWQVFDFDFIHGEPFSEADFGSGLHTAVVSEELARNLYGKSDAVGEILRMGATDYRVCGVVKSPNYAMNLTYAQVWIPYTCQPYTPDTYLGGVFGSYSVAILLHSPLDAGGVKAQVDDYVRKFNATPHDGYRLLMHGQPYLYWKTLFRVGEYHIFDIDYSVVLRQIGIWLLLLLIVPALNLSGMIASRMERRLPEMGIRKAFGASRGRLFSQVVWENLLLTCMGGVLGVVISYVMVLLAKDWLLTLLDGGTKALPAGVEMGITADMLFNPVLFIVAFLVCVVLNLLSALIPAAVALRKDIVYSLNQKE